jgi:TetR/AcrR family transcriptional repressor of mexJK operon
MQIAPRTVFCRPSRKREAVLDAAQDCFLELGYAATSMDLVASRAGVSKATIYAHFAGKDDLFGAVINRRCDRDPIFPDGLPEEGDARAILTAVATRLMALLISPETQATYRVVVAEAARHPDLATAFWEVGPGQGKARLTAMFEELTRRGALDVPDPWAAADQFAAMMRGEIFNRLLLGLPLPDGRDAAGTVAAAVDTIMRAYAVRPSGD